MGNTMKKCTSILIPSIDGEEIPVTKTRCEKLHIGQPYTSVFCAKKNAYVVPQAKGPAREKRVVMADSSNAILLRSVKARATSYRDPKNKPLPHRPFSKLTCVATDRCKKMCENNTATH
jgi:hypothetical protein